MSRGHCLSFEPCWSGNRKAQSGDICSRSNQEKASVSAEVVCELIFEFIADCQVFFKSSSKNVRFPEFPEVSERGFIKRNIAAYLFKRKDFLFRLVTELENRICLRKVSGYCYGTDWFELVNAKGPHGLCAFGRSCLDCCKLSSFDCIVKEVQNLLEYFFQEVERGHSVFLRKERNDGSNCSDSAETRKEICVFHGLLPSVLKFSLEPLFSHALGKAS